jgi:hypothetical protein
MIFDDEYVRQFLFESVKMVILNSLMRMGNLLSQLA